MPSTAAQEPLDYMMAPVQQDGEEDGRKEVRKDRFHGCPGNCVSTPPP